MKHKNQQEQIDYIEAMIEVLIEQSILTMRLIKEDSTTLENVRNRIIEAKHLNSDGEPGILEPS